MSETTGFTPFYLLYGRRAHVPLETFLSARRDEFGNQLDDLAVAYQEARDNIGNVRMYNRVHLAIMRALPQQGNRSATLHLDLSNKDNYEPKYLDMSDNDGYPENLVAHHLSWTSIILVMSLLILCTCVGIWIFRRRFKIQYFFKDALKGAKLAKIRGQGPDHTVHYSTKAPQSVQVITKPDEVLEIADIV